MIDVYFYKEINGSCPIEEYLEHLDSKMRAKVYRTIALLEQFGPMLREPYSKYLGDGIFELRVKQGTDIERIMYFFFVDGHAILTNGFTKKQTKTPLSELKIAKRRRSDYMRRYMHE